MSLSGSWYNGGTMLKNDAVRLAESLVREKYRMVPTVKSAKSVAPPALEMNPAEPRPIADGPCPPGGGWLVKFAYPEGGRPADMPKRLAVYVDAATATAELLPELGESPTS
jgi:hypothetical protein